MLALRSGISFCVIDETVIFLDDRRDRYFALVGDRAAQFLSIATRRDNSERCGASGQAMAGFDTILEDSQTGAALRPCQVQPPQADCASIGRAQVGRVLLALASMMATLVRLRLRSFHRNITAPDQDPSAATRQDLDNARRALPGFEVALRIFPRRLECLALALSLRTYLQWLSIGSDFVIGVKRDPFAAHCWIQIANHVLCDRIERIGGFTPIRSVP